MESAIFLCNCKDDSSHIDPLYHDKRCAYRAYVQNKKNVHPQKPTEPPDIIKLCVDCKERPAMIGNVYCSVCIPSAEPLDTQREA